MNRLIQLSMCSLLVNLTAISGKVPAEEAIVPEPLPAVLEMYSATKEKKEGFTAGQYSNDKSLYCGAKIDFSDHVAEASCSREPGDNAPYHVFIFLNEVGGQKLKKLTQQSLKQFVAIDVNGKSAGITRIQVVHNLVNYGGKQRGLITFSVGDDHQRGKALAKAINKCVTN